MSSATHSVNNTSSNLTNARQKYDSYSDKIGRSQKLVAEIQRAERWDELKLQYSFNFFCGTAGYLVAKRFFLWEIIYAVYFLAVVFCQHTTNYVVLPLF